MFTAQTSFMAMTRVLSRFQGPSAGGQSCAIAQRVNLVIVDFSISRGVKRAVAPSAARLNKATNLAIGRRRSIWPSTAPTAVASTSTAGVHGAAKVAIRRSRTAACVSWRSPYPLGITPMVRRHVSADRRQTLTNSKETATDD